MGGDDRLAQLSAFIGDLDEDRALGYTRQLILDGEDPLKIIEFANKGVVEVGIKYENGIYFISGLVMAGEIMAQISEMVLPLTMGKTFGRPHGRVLVGTVEGDIHYIGKDIFKAFLSSHGFSVHDLGVDVTKEQFLDGVKKYKPDIVGFSCMLSSCVDRLTVIIAYLRAHLQNGNGPKAYLAGGRVMGERVRKEIGADWAVSDSLEGVRLCEKIMGRPS